jgi:hypothetical protein
LTLRLAYLAYFVGAFNFGWRLSGLYTFAYLVGCALGIPLMYRASHELKARGIKLG